MIRPYRDRIFVTRTSGHGVEEVTAGGIILPATKEKSVRTKGDWFRARVEAIGPEAAKEVPDLAVGEEIIVYTYSGNAETVWTGDAGAGGLFIRPDDILGVVSP